MESLKEAIAFLRQIWGALLTLMSALAAWLAITEEQIVAVGLGFAVLFVSIIIFTFVQLKIFSLLYKLKEKEDGHGLD